MPNTSLREATPTTSLRDATRTLSTSAQCPIPSGSKFLLLAVFLEMLKNNY
ncbi:MAG: hypothetical protein ACYTXA_31020 [Nostoc sp.]